MFRPTVGFGQGFVAAANKQAAATNNIVSEKNWIKGAVNPDHKGYCTPMTKKTCTPRRKALAKRFKSGDLHKGK